MRSTHTDKAIEILNKFWHVKGTKGQISLSVARNCALIAVNEILANCSLFKRKYWEKVKQALENL